MTDPPICITSVPTLSRPIKSSLKHGEESIFLAAHRTGVSVNQIFLPGLHEYLIRSMRVASACLWAISIPLQANHLQCSAGAKRAMK